MASGRVGALRTDLSADDSVVALFGGFFEGVRQNFGLSLGSFGEIGSSGISGFQDSGAHTHEPKYFPGGHGGPVKSENFASLANFVVSGVTEVDPTLLVPARSKQVSLLARFSVLAMFAIVAFLPVGGWGISWIAHRYLHAPTIGAVLGYIAFILAILLFL